MHTNSLMLTQRVTETKYNKLTLPGVADTMPWDGIKPPVGGGGGGPPIPDTESVLGGSADGWYRGGCDGDDRFTANDDSGTGADGTGDLPSGAGLYLRSGMPSTPELAGGAAAG